MQHRRRRDPSRVAADVRPTPRTTVQGAPSSGLAYADAVRVPIAALVLALGCDPDTAVLEIDLREDGCTADDWSTVRVLSVEVYGTDDAGDRCALARRCVFDVDLPSAAQDVADIDAALRAANQPLVDLDRDGASIVQITAHTDGCWSDLGLDGRPTACGANELAEADDGRLGVVMRCGSCSAEEVPLCK